jgi:hypothetical protein
MQAEGCCASTIEAIGTPTSAWQKRVWSELDTDIQIKPIIDPWLQDRLMKEWRAFQQHLKNPRKNDQLVSCIHRA